MNANRKGKKMSTTDVAAVTLQALARKHPMALPGQTKLLPALLRIAPGTTRRMVGSI
jgi:uncharacterized oxidoreductase